jgi:hypothetical protein
MTCMSKEKTDPRPFRGGDSPAPDEVLLSLEWSRVAVSRNDDARGIIAEKVERWSSKAVSLFVKAVESHMLVRWRWIWRRVVALVGVLFGFRVWYKE